METPRSDPSSARTDSYQQQSSEWISSGAPPSLPAMASLLSSSSRAISNTTKNGTVVGAPRYHLSLPAADAAHTTEKEVIVDDDDERGNVAKQCRNESLVTPEGRQACVVLCQQRRCCFDFGPFNCRSARKEWCQEYDICSNLAAAPPANPEVSENGESQLDRDGN